MYIILDYRDLVQGSIAESTKNHLNYTLSQRVGWLHVPVS